MATQIWRGDAQPVAQVVTLTPASVTVGDVFKVTINNKVVSYTAAAGTVADVCVGLQALLAASAIAEFQEVTWTTDGVTNITGTASTAGVPFTATPSVVDAGGSTSTFTLATVTASSGPNDVSTAANWSSGSLPANGDDIYFSNTSSAALYGLTALAAVAPASVNQDSTFTGTIGLPKVNSSGYREYRPDYLQFGATTKCLLGTNPNSGPGSGRIKLDFQAAAVPITVYSTGQALEQGVPALLVKGTALTSLEVLYGSAGVAFFAGEVSTLPLVNVGYTNSPLSDVTLYLGAGCTLTTVNQSGGQVTAQANVTTWIQTNGTTSFLAGAIATLAVTGGTHYYESTGTITQGKVSGPGVLDFSRDMRGRTVTNMNCYGNGQINDPFKTVTWTDAPQLLETGLYGPQNQQGFILNLGDNISLLPTNLGA